MQYFQVPLSRSRVGVPDLSIFNPSEREMSDLKLTTESEPSYSGSIGTGSMSCDCLPYIDSLDSWQLQVQQLSAAICLFVCNFVFVANITNIANIECNY